MANVIFTLMVLAAMPLLLGWVGSFISPLVIVLIPCGLIGLGVVLGLRKWRPQEPVKQAARPDLGRLAQIHHLHERRARATVHRQSKHQRYG